jgi:catechol 2,3-dioxygenase-like lactoylglutathione lyase family enzyme
MKHRYLLLTASLSLAAAAALALRIETPAHAQTDELGTPGFHHLHLLTTNPDAALDFYASHFATAKKSTWGGMPAISTPNNVLILFTKVDRPALTSPQTAIWHFGWNVTDERAKLAEYLSKFPKDLAPLYTGDGDKFVYVSSDTWPGASGSLGRTREQVEEAKRDNIQPQGGAGFGYLKDPDGNFIEFAGNQPQERFNHVHMFYDDPRCATLWYQQHLNVPAGGRGGRGRAGSAPAEPITEANCKVQNDYTRSWPSLTKDGMVRTATGGGAFGDVTVSGYVRQYPTPLVSTRGHTADHIGLSVKNLDAWLAKLRRENVKILMEPYKLGDTRAAMIEGPSQVALELVEVK